MLTHTTHTHNHTHIHTYTHTHTQHTAHTHTHTNTRTHTNSLCFSLSLTHTLTHSNLSRVHTIASWSGVILYSCSTTKFCAFECYSPRCLKQKIKCHFFEVLFGYSHVMSGMDVLTQFNKHAECDDPNIVRIHHRIMI